MNIKITKTATVPRILFIVASGTGSLWQGRPLGGDEFEIDNNEVCMNPIGQLILHIASEEYRTARWVRNYEAIEISGPRRRPQRAYRRFQRKLKRQLAPRLGYRLDKIQFTFS